MRKRKDFSGIFKRRIRGKIIPSDYFLEGLPEGLFSFFESVQETAILALILTAFSQEKLLLPFFFVWALWNGFSKGFNVWRKLRKLNRAIEKEKWEIEHRRDEERKELQAIYRAKGFQGDLLEEVIDVLMADQNRLLQVMVEEEMGIELESFEHPLKKGVFAFLGALLSGLFLSLLSIFGNTSLLFLGIAALILGMTFIRIYFEHEEWIEILLWNVAIALLVGVCGHFLHQFFLWAI